MSDYDVIIEFSEESVSVKAESKTAARSIAMEEIAERIRQGNLSFYITEVNTEY